MIALHPRQIPRADLSSSLYDNGMGRREADVVMTSFRKRLLATIAPQELVGFDDEVIIVANSPGERCPEDCEEFPAAVAEISARRGASTGNPERIALLALAPRLIRAWA